jgi:hypothetical protein
MRQLKRPSNKRLKLRNKQLKPRQRLNKRLNWQRLNKRLWQLRRMADNPLLLRRLRHNPQRNPRHSLSTRRPCKKPRGFGPSPLLRI